MDKLTKYRQIVRQLTEEYAQHRPSHGEVEAEAIIDTEKDHYQVMHLGWHDQRRIYGAVIHMNIAEGKIWIQYDGTDRPVADRLLEAGVPREDIILGLHPPNVRQYTDFGVA